MMSPSRICSGQAVEQTSHSIPAWPTWPSLQQGTVSVGFINNQDLSEEEAVW